ncbi:hypothetical protein GTW69_29995, partial [Streptomyces sp. SID7760]|nr:hypothetical protein [Streptomyces sp. SID7760]
MRHSAGEIHVLFRAETEEREWAVSGEKAADGPNPTALPAQAIRVRMRKPPPSGNAAPLPCPRTRMPTGWSITPTEAAPHPGPGSGRCHTALDGHPPT